MARKAGTRWDEFLSSASKKVADGLGKNMVPVPEYEDFPMSYQTFLSWYNKTELSCLWDFYRSDYTGALLKTIDIPVKVLLGELDEYVVYPEFNVTATSALNFLKTHIPHCETTCIKQANHTYQGYEQQVAEAVIQFL